MPPFLLKLLGWFLGPLAEKLFGAVTTAIDDKRDDVAHQQAGANAQAIQSTKEAEADEDKAKAIHDAVIRKHSQPVADGVQQPEPNAKYSRD
jgi:hypothetical protein